MMSAPSGAMVTPCGQLSSLVRASLVRDAPFFPLPAMMVMMGAYRVGGLGVTPDAAQADAWEAKLVALSPTYKKDPVSTQGKPKKVNGK